MKIDEETKKDAIKGLVISSVLPHLFVAQNILSENKKINGAFLRFSEKATSKAVSQAARWGFAYKISVEAGAFYFLYRQVEKQLAGLNKDNQSLGH